jgi:hypothetical protein
MSAIVSEQMMRSLTERANRLADRVELATRRSPRPDVRRDGARFGEVLDEWLDDIKELREIGDEHLRETVQSFNARLDLAEQKVKAWFGSTDPDEILKLEKPRNRTRAKKLGAGKSSRAEQRPLKKAG